MKTEDRYVWPCPKCGTNYILLKEEEPYCVYCAEQEIKENKPVGIPYNILWRGFWAGVEKIDRENYSKSELLNIKEFFEGMVSDE